MPDKWIPQPGPQTLAYNSPANILGYGGAAGGGKTDLSIGLAITRHKRSIIYRKEATQLNGIYDRVEEVLGNRDGFNSQSKQWRIKGDNYHILEFGGLANPDDHKKFQGRPHDLVCFDEATEIPYHMIRFLLGWLRSRDKAQRCRAIMTFNPPTTQQGRWVLEFFAPWLDPKHPNPAKPGELRWFTTVAGKDHECDGPEPIEIDGELVKPLSRTFIPAKVEDNLFYMETGYKAMLQALPEPLRSQMLKGDFNAGIEADPWQVIPDEWVEAAMERWEPLKEHVPMDSMGVDVARGGKDQTVISCRHGAWFDKLKKYPGSETPDGPTTAGYVIAARRDQAPVHIDLIGWGSSPYDFLVENGIQTVGINAAASAKDDYGKPKITESGMSFFNWRSFLWWSMREALDPANGLNIQLPPDDDLKSQLCTPKWSYGKQGIKIESKETIFDRIKRSTDDADAVVMANVDTPKEAEKVVLDLPQSRGGWMGA